MTLEVQEKQEIDKEEKKVVNQKKDEDDLKDKNEEKKDEEEVIYEYTKEDTDLYDKKKKLDYKINFQEYFEHAFKLISSTKRDERLEGLILVRKSVSNDGREKPIQHIIDCRMVPTFIKFLYIEDRDVQFESSWIITNLASGTNEQCLNIVSNDAIPALVNLLPSKDLDLVEQAIWGLANISANDTNSRDLVLDFNVTQIILELVFYKGNQKTYLKTSFLKNVSWLFFNICRTPKPPFERIVNLLPFFEFLFLNCTDEEILCNVCRSLSTTLSEISEERVDFILGHSFLDKVIELLYYEGSQSYIQTSSLRFIGNVIYNGNDRALGRVLSFKGIIPYLLKLLSSEKKYLRKESAWIVSNIGAGLQREVQLLIDSGIVKKIIEFYVDDEVDVRKECIWTIYNCIISGSSQQILQLVSFGVIDSLVQLFKKPFNVEEVNIQLGCIQKILMNGNFYFSYIQQKIDQNPMVPIFLESDFLNIINEFIKNNNQTLTTQHTNKLISIFEFFKSDYINLYKKSNNNDTIENSTKPNNSLEYISPFFIHIEINKQYFK